MRHHDRPDHHDHPGRPDRSHSPDRPRFSGAGASTHASGRHRRSGGTGRRAARRPSFRTTVTLTGAAAALLAVVTGMYVAPSAPAVSAAVAPAAAGAKIGRYAQEVVALANAERERAGCGPLRAEDHLRTAAQGHADDMAARDYYRHDSPEGRDAGDRITGAGYAWSTWGENIHRGPRTPARAMEDWMESPGHRANILNCAFRDIGVGVTLTANGPWWVQDFGARR
ncbi:CAP domain-containing protein [Streptomyces sp. NPDC056361]|uniref:CAP domain-containing protein n=1 Tax=Streptomyces sp. NPDC056361 TaxID=3345795 RepID=UPI0035D58861